MTWRQSAQTQVKTSVLSTTLNMWIFLTKMNMQYLFEVLSSFALKKAFSLLVLVIFLNTQEFLKNVSGVGKIFYTTKVITWISIGPVSFVSCISTNFIPRLSKNCMTEKSKGNPGIDQFALIVILNFLDHIKERSILSLNTRTKNLNVKIVLNCSSACSHWSIIS